MIVVGYRNQVIWPRLFDSIGAVFVVLAASCGLAACEPSAPSNSTSAARALSASNRGDAPGSLNAAVDRVAEFESPTGAWRLRYWPTPDPIPRNELFELDVELVSADPDIAITAVDARMPEHRHGMSLRPQLHALGAGRYRVEGLLFHMSGFWELFFRVERGATTQRVRFEVVLE